MKVKIRFKYTKLSTIAAKLDNGFVLHGNIIHPEYAWQVQRKFGLFGTWQHFLWSKNYPKHLEFML